MSCSGAASPSTSRSSALASRRPRALRERLREALAKGPVHRACRDRHGVSSPPEPHAGGRRPRPFEGGRSGWCWSPTSRSQAPTTTPAAAARCSRPPWPSTTRCAEVPRPHPSARSRSCGLTRFVAAEQWIKDHPADAKKRAGDVVARHDRRGHRQDRRHVPDRKGPRPVGDVGATVRPATRSGARARSIPRSCGAVSSTTCTWPSACAAHATPAGSCAPIRMKAAAITPSSPRTACRRLLNWHFTDRYYHTNLDTVDKTSPAEMQHVGDRGRDHRVVPGDGWRRAKWRR